MTLSRSRRVTLRRWPIRSVNYPVPIRQGRDWARPRAKPRRIASIARAWRANSYRFTKRSMRRGTDQMRVLYINAGNMFGGVETFLATLARSRGLTPGVEPEFAVCFNCDLSYDNHGPPTPG